MVLLSTHNIYMFHLRNKKIIFIYPFLSKDLILICFVSRTRLWFNNINSIENIAFWALKKNFHLNNQCMVTRSYTRGLMWWMDQNPTHQNYDVWKNRMIFVYCMIFKLQWNYAWLMHERKWRIKKELQWNFSGSNMDGLTWYRTLGTSAYQKTNFLISQLKHMLWVLKRTVSMRQFFWAPKTYVKTDG